MRSMSPLSVSLLLLLVAVACHPVLPMDTGDTGSDTVSLLTLSRRPSLEVALPRGLPASDVFVRLRCLSTDTLDYRYSSNINLFGDVNQRYATSADVHVRCMGADDQHAASLRYAVTLSSVRVTPVNAPPAGEGNSDDDADQGMIREQVQVELGDREELLSVGDSREAPLDANYSTPFQFVQRANGEIAEVRLAANDTDVDVRNLKRGVAAAFQTQLNTRSAGGSRSVPVRGVNGDYNANHRFLRVRGLDKVVSEGERRENVQVNRQELEFSEGVLRRTVGSFSFKLEDESSDAPSRRPAVTRLAHLDSVNLDAQSDTTTDIDVAEDIRADAHFTLTLQTRQKRSLSEGGDINLDGLRFVSTGLAAENDVSQRQVISKVGHKYKGRLGREAIRAQLEGYVDGEDGEDTSALNPIKDLLFEDVYDNSCHKANTASARVATFVSSVGEEWCVQNAGRCLELYRVASYGCGPVIERLFEVALEPEISILPTEMRADIVNVAALLGKPSNEFVKTLITLWKRERSDELRDNLLLAVASAASQGSVSDGVREALAGMLETAYEEVASVDGKITVLEGMGNLGSSLNTNFLQRVYTEESSVQNGTAVALTNVARAALRALRKQFEVSEGVRHFFMGVLMDDRLVECDDIREILRVIAEGELAGNEGEDDGIVDEFMEEVFLAAPVIGDCFLEQQDGVEEGRDGARRRVKRGWTHSTSTQWGHSSYNNVIQSSAQFSADRSTYTRRKHFLANKRLGASKANARLYFGAFAGRGTGAAAGKHKLFTSVVVKGFILKKNFNVGSVLTYREVKSSTKQRVYINIGGKVLLDSRSTSCSTQTRQYERSWYINIYSINIYGIAKLSVGARITPKIRLELSCTTSGGVTQLMVKPKAILRIGGEAQASLLSVVRGGITIGVNLNYYFRSRVESVPCISGQHGYDPMSISISAWYQIRYKIKIKIRWWPPRIRISWKWGRRRTWSPSSLRWRISRGRQFTWLARTCDSSSGGGGVIVNPTRPPIRVTLPPRFTLRPICRGTRPCREIL